MSWARHKSHFGVVLLSFWLLQVLKASLAPCSPHLIPINTPCLANPKAQVWAKENLIFSLYFQFPLFILFVFEP